ncbi:MAG: hypothetical protein ABI901_18035 [Roseiflexaceae bacterium]
MHRRIRTMQPLLMFTSIALVLVVALLVTTVLPSFAQGGGDDDTQPAPPSIGADVPVTYFGPPPSAVQKELVGPVQLLKSGTVDDDAGTITLPLYQGKLKNGKKVWYVLTDTTDKANADALGLNFSGKLGYAVGRAVRTAQLEQDTTLTFDKGAVDFAPAHKLVAGDQPHPFPPKVAEPGAIGDKDYSPLVRITNIPGTPIYNAPIVAFDVDANQINFCDGNPDYHRVHDHVVKICPNGNGGGTVTLALAPGFSFAKPVLYLSLDANDAPTAALENVTFAPALKNVTIGRDDSAFSAVERLFAAINGPTGADNPQRQGFNSALTDPNVHGPLNVIGGIPTVATDYSPLWDVNAFEWTQEAIDKGYRSRVTEEFFILGLAKRGFITGPGGKPFGSTGIIVNCPIVKRYL